MEELLSNALIHGNRKNKDKQITMRMSFDAERFVLVVKDEGDGFDGTTYLEKIRNNQTAIPEKRGLFIADLLVDELRFNEKCNEVTAVIYRKNRVESQ